MKKPNALVQLLDDLETELLESSAVTLDDSWMKVYLGDNDDAIELTRHEAERLMHSPQTIRQLFEALDEPDDCAIEIHNVSLEHHCQDALERYFSAVDEA